jgi:cytoskeletal protein CcmA (bactofilin family)
MMMSKNKEENPSNGGLHNALSTGTTIKGDVTTENDFRLDGKVEGNILCKGKIVVGPKGHVAGNIISVNAEILGKIEGSLKISAKITLKSSAVIDGDIQTPVLEIEPNARFNGTCIMNSGSGSTASGTSGGGNTNAHPTK